MVSYLVHLHLLKGRKVEDNIFSETAIELLRLFQTRYQFLDIKELECIFENGIYGNYGEVFEISATLKAKGSSLFPAPIEQIIGILCFLASSIMLSLLLVVTYLP